MARPTGLRDAKRAATLVLVACVATLIASRLLAARWPAMAYVAAFAEAAVIGGLADWYAVVAIFRRPLGLPLPHTAIVVRERDRIAERLGAFIAENFLGAETLDRRLQEIDFVDAARRWLRDPLNAEQIAGRLVAIAPFVLDAVEKSGLRDDVFGGLRARLEAFDAGRAASSLLRSSFVVRNRHRILDAALAGVLNLLSSPQALRELREGMRREMPALLKLAGGDNAVFRKTVLAVAAYVEDVRANPDHALHGDFETLMDKVAEDVEASPEAGRAISQLRDELIAAVDIETLGRRACEAARRIVTEQGDAVARALSQGLADAMPRAAELLDLTDEQSSRINRALRTAVAGAIESRRSEIGRFVASQVKSWDADQMVALVEENIGPDLQYIRMNGAVVGGLAGLVIFSLVQAFGGL